MHIRLARDDLGWVEKLARDVGVSPHFLMRETIVRHARDVAAVLLAEAPPPPRPVELAPWLAGRTGIAASLMRRAIATGRVSVAGEVCREPRADVEQGVTLDGESV